MQYSTWREELIQQGRDNITLHDRTVHDYVDIRKASKASNCLSTPVAYMEAHGVFEPLASTTNLLGLCWFYHMEPASATSVPTPNHPATVCHLKGLLKEVQEQGQPYIIVMFKGSNVMLLSLLLELHL